MSEMKRARKMCRTCPFRGMETAERHENAVIEPEMWPCHTEHPMGWGDTQCRGHFEARRKYPPQQHEIDRLNVWRDRMSKAFAAGVPAHEIPLAPVRDPIPGPK